MAIYINHGLNSNNKNTENHIQGRDLFRKKLIIIAPNMRSMIFQLSSSLALPPNPASSSLLLLRTMPHSYKATPFRSFLKTTINPIDSFVKNPETSLKFIQSLIAYLELKTNNKGRTVQNQRYQSAATDLGKPERFGLKL